MTFTVHRLFRNYVGLKKGFITLFNMKYMENNRTDFNKWKMEFGNHFEKKKKKKDVQEHKVLILISTGNEIQFKCSSRQKKKKNILMGSSKK